MPVAVIAQEFWSHGWKGCTADSKLEGGQADLDVLPVFPDLQKISICNDF